MDKTPINYEERAAAQKDVVAKLAESLKKAPSDEKKAELQRETELLRHYSNAAQGIPKERSQNIYAKARTAALNEAVQQFPDE